LYQRKRIARIIFGWLFIILGLLGLVLPILQGILFLAIGILLLAPEVPFFNTLLQKLKKRYPRLARKADKMTKRIHKKYIATRSNRPVDN